ncbi:restriction endonuclease subunit S [Vibrio nereis]|uniref:restriction endonuclease subunit S n=1 Tax=Vibrio nereis TaxID=693 RepID=UPI003CD0C94D
MSLDQTPINQLITDNIDTWTSTVKTKATTGRGSSKKLELYGVKKLRELILELAFSGKLVENEPQKVSLDCLLDEMHRERVEFHERKGVRLQKFKELPDTKLSFVLPSSWEVVSFNDVITYITDFQANGSFSTIKQNVQYFDNPDYAMLLRLTDLRHGLTDSSSYKYTDKKGYDFLSKSSVHGGELVVANVGAGVGTTLEVPQIEMPTTLAPNMFMVVLSKQVEKSYFLYFCQSPKYKQYIEMVNTGTGQPKINKTEYKNCQLPFPSLKEQVQIVAKINQLMTLCDKLEQQTEASITAHQVLVTTLLDTLTNSANAEELMQNWQMVAEHFNTLFTTEESIDQLKQTILQLAVMGKLVPQDPNDEPAAKLLERIAEEKAQLIKEKKIKKQKALPPIADDEKPFELPKGWEWCRFGALVNFKAELVRPENFTTFEQIAPDSIEKGTGKLIKRRTVAESGVKGPNSRFYTGQILYSKIRPSLSKAIIAEFDGLCSADMYPLEAMVDSEFLLKTILSEIFLVQVRAAENRIKMPKLNVESLSNIIVPICSENEMRRITTRLSELMVVSDHLKHCIHKSKLVQSQLTDAIVEQAV